MLKMLPALLLLTVPLVAAIIPAHPVSCFTTSDVPCAYACEPGEMVWIGITKGPGTITFDGCGLSATHSCPSTACAGKHIGYATLGTAICQSDAQLGVCEKAWVCPPSCPGAPEE